MDVVYPCFAEQIVAWLILFRFRNIDPAGREVHKIPLGIVAKQPPEPGVVELACSIYFWLVHGSGFLTFGVVFGFLEVPVVGKEGSDRAGEGPAVRVWGALQLE